MPCACEIEGLRRAILALSFPLLPVLSPRTAPALLSPLCWAPYARPLPSPLLPLSTCGAFPAVLPFQVVLAVAPQSSASLFSLTMALTALPPCLPAALLRAICICLPLS